MGIDERHLSAETRVHFQRQRRRLRLRRFRQSFLFLVLIVVGIWGWLTHRADHKVFAWDRPVTVAFVALLDQAEGENEDVDFRFVERFVSRAAIPRDNLRHVEKWVQEEYTRHTGDESPAFEFSIRGPLRLTSSPPKIPDGSGSFWSRWKETRAFMSYFVDLSKRDELMLASYDVTVFIYFYDYYDAERRSMFGNLDSLANRREGIGVVFAPISTELRGNTCAVVAHELCHTLGASDKYDDDRSVYPEGYVEPNRQPRYPQDFAEIMALGLPTRPGRDEPVSDLQECRVGDASAAEMNWKPPAR